MPFLQNRILQLLFYFKILGCEKVCTLKKRLTGNQYINQNRMGLNQFLIRSEDRRSNDVFQ